MGKIEKAGKYCIVKNETSQERLNVLVNRWNDLEFSADSPSLRRNCECIKDEILEIYKQFPDVERMTMKDYGL